MKRLFLLGAHFLFIWPFILPSQTFANGIVPLLRSLIETPSESFFLALRRWKRTPGKKFYFTEIYPQLPLIPPLVRMNKILEETEDSFILEVDTLDSLRPRKLTREEIVIKKKDIPRDSFYYLPQHPRLEALFKAVEFPRKEITSQDLQIPLQKDEESLLKKKGYPASFIKGIDEVSEWIVLRKRLEKLRANPYKTHIDYFANHITPHLEFAKNIIDSQGFEKIEYISRQFKAFDSLEKNAKKAISQKKVTYVWWLQFNFNLAHIISNTEFLSNNNYPDFALPPNWIVQFPLKMAVPTLQEDLGVIALNRISTKGIFPVRLVNWARAMAQGFSSPIVLMEYDYIRTTLQEPKTHLWNVPGYIFFQRKALLAMEKLSVEKRKMAEMLYFLITQDHQFSTISFFPPQNPQDLKAKLIESFTKYSLRSEEKMFGIESHMGDSQIQEIGEQYVNVFIKIYKKVYGLGEHSPSSPPTGKNLP